MNQKIMSYVPKTKIEAIRDAYKDEDGYWIILNEGWEASRTDSGCRTIHEDTIKDLRYQIAGIQRVTSEEPEAEETVISGNTINGIEFHYNPESHSFIVRDNESWVNFETVEEVMAFTKEMALKEEREAEAEITEEPDPDEYQKIQDSMTESFYEFCTGEPAPENWKETVRTNRKPIEKHLPTPASSGNIKIIPATQLGPGAAEAVMFGVFLAIAVTWHVSRNFMELLAVTISTLLYRAWNHRERIREGLILTVRWTATKRRTALAWTVSTGKEAVAVGAILVFMVRIALQ